MRENWDSSPAIGTKPENPASLSGCRVLWFDEDSDFPAGIVRVVPDVVLKINPHRSDERLLAVRADWAFFYGAVGDIRQISSARFLV